MSRSIIDLGRTEAEVAESRIASAAASIRRDWPHMLPTEAAGAQIRSGRSRSAGVLASDDAAEYDTQGREYHRDDWTPSIPGEHHRPADGDIDGMTRIVSLRRHATEMLNGWCRVVMEERDITNPKSLPLCDDVAGMCRFLETHAQWIGPQDFAEACVAEIESFAARVSGVVDPPRREAHRLGPCPFVVEGEGGVHDRTCRGVVTIPIGGDQGDASCSECERAAPVEWWEQVIGRDLGSATLPQLVRIIHSRLHVDVTERSLQRWVRSGRIAVVEVESDGPHRMYDVRSFVDEVSRLGHQCVMCGESWEWGSDVCARCYRSLRDAQPTRRDREIPAYTIGSVVPVRRKVAATEEGVCTLEEQQSRRCDETGMPMAWCACGQH